MDTQGGAAARGGRVATTISFRRGDVIAKRYQVVTKSGESSLWVGYHGFDRNNLPAGEQRMAPEPDVLIKIVRPELVAEGTARSHLLRELQRVRGLQHPGMPRLVDLQPLDELGSVALIEPMQAGLSQGVLLRRMVTFRQNEKYTLEEIRQINAQIASALSYVHGQMLSHGDLRLESVILRPDGAKLCDIGLGAALPRGPYLDAVRKAGEADLLAPEVRAGKQPDALSDVFGLASLFRYLISMGQQAAWDAFMAEKPAMGLVLMRGMAEESGHRYASIEALIADVEAVALTGAPIRKRLAQTPLAMAVAAGRLPVEDLNRSLADLNADSPRAKRNSGMYEVASVLAPISGGPAAKMSIGTIPPSMASTRSGRLVSAESGEFRAHGSGGPTSRSGGFPSIRSGTGSESLSSSALSARITMPGRVHKAAGDSGDKAPAVDSQGGPGERKAAAGGGTSDALTGSDRSIPREIAPSAEPTRRIVGGGAGGEGARGAEGRSGRAQESASPTSQAASPPAVEGPRPAVPVDVSSGLREAKAIGAPAAGAVPEREGAGRLGQEPSGGFARPKLPPGPPVDARTANDRSRPLEKRSGLSPASPSASSRSGSTDSGKTATVAKSGGSLGELRTDRTVPSLPPGMVVASKSALFIAMLMAAVVGALVAVVTTLLLRNGGGSATGPEAPAPGETVPKLIPLPAPNPLPPAGTKSPTSETVR